MMMDLNSYLTVQEISERLKVSFYVARIATARLEPNAIRGRQTYFDAERLPEIQAQVNALRKKHTDLVTA